MLIHRKTIYQMNQLDEVVNIMGKGDMPRPGAYSQEYKDNWERIFGKKKKKKDQKEVKKKQFLWKFC